MIPCQLRMNSFLRCGRESSHSGIWIWVLCFPTQRCSNGLAGHTLRSPSQTLERMETFKEKDRENGWENSQCPPLLFYFSKVFIMFRCGARLHSAELTLVVMIVQYWPGNHHICKRSGLSQTTRHDTAHYSFNLVDGMRLSMPIYWSRREDGKSLISQSGVS